MRTLLALALVALALAPAGCAVRPGAPCAGLTTNCFE